MLPHFFPLDMLRLHCWSHWMSHSNCNLPVHMSCLISLRIPYFIFGLYIQHYEPLKLKQAFLLDSCCLFISFISNLAYLVRFTFTNSAVVYTASNLTLCISSSVSCRDLPSWYRKAGLMSGTPAASSSLQAALSYCVRQVRAYKCLSCLARSQMNRMTPRD